jgi:hypothetical protein
MGEKTHKELEADYRKLVKQAERDMEMLQKTAPPHPWIIKIKKWLRI